MNIENIEINCHSSIKMKGEKTIYIDPFKIEKQTNDADIIFITHNHYDHYSEEDINKVINKDTIIIAQNCFCAINPVRMSLNCTFC